VPLFPILLVAILLLTTLHAEVSTELLPPKAQELLKDVHRVVFLGDSITQAGNYVTDVECWLLRHGTNIEILNLGLGSESGTDLTPEENAGHVKKYGFGHPFVSERLGRVLEQSKPDVLFVCYGMNDCGGLPGNETGTARYGEAITRIRDAALKSGVKHAVICTPPIHDDGKSGASDPSEQSLARYTAWLLGKKKEGWEVVDIHTPMRSALDATRSKDPSFLYSEDHVHPDREGHWLMAREIIRQAFGGEVPDLYCSEQLFPCLGAEIRDLVHQREMLLFYAWMTKIGHKRPNVPGGPNAQPGPSLEEAQTKAKGMTDQIEKKLQLQQLVPSTIPPPPESPKLSLITRPPEGEFSPGFTPSNILTHHTDQGY
jgi:lysophospholipase L1-like esterase